MRWCVEDLGLALRWRHGYWPSTCRGHVAFPLAAVPGNLTFGKEAIVVVLRNDVSCLLVVMVVGEDRCWDHPRKLRLLVGVGPSSSSMLLVALLVTVN